MATNKGKRMLGPPKVHLCSADDIRLTGEREKMFRSFAWLVVLYALRRNLSIMSRCIVADFRGCSAAEYWRLGQRILG